MRVLRNLLAGIALVAAGPQAFAQGEPSSTLVPNPTTKIVLPAPGLPTAAAATHALTKDDVDNWLDGYLPFALRSSDIPGADVVVVKDGQILTVRGFGYADIAKRTPVDPEKTLFRPGSISKLFTWTAVMQMVEQHKIDLDGDINQYLDFKIPAYQGQPVTMRQLMTHTGGFEEVAQGVAFYDPKYIMSLEAYLKRWTPTRIFPAGTTPAYSNWGTALAAYIVQRQSGEEFDTYVEHHIFGPLGMHNATFRQPLPANLAGQMATGYSATVEPKPFELIGPAPAGSVSISATDMARFMIAQLQRGSYQGAQILRPETADLMHDSPLDRVNPRSLIPPLSRMELGFFETNVNGREVIGHLGDVEAFHSSLHLFMKENVGLYISFNGPGKDAAVQTLRTGMFDDFADRYFPDVAPADGRVDAKTSAQHAAMMAGRWMASRRADSNFLSAFYWLGGQAVVSVGPKGELVIPSITYPGGRPRQWTEIAPFVWRDANGHDRLAAQVVDGQVVRWSYDFASPFEVFDRVPASRNAGWLVPAFFASIAILLIAFLCWPIAFLIRRTFAAPAPVAGTALKAQRATRLVAGLEAGTVIAWIVTIMNALKDPDALAGGVIPAIWTLKILSIVVVVGTVGIAGWNAWLTCTDGRRWNRKVWSVLILLSSLLLLYVAVTFHVLALEVHF